MKVERQRPFQLQPLPPSDSLTSLHGSLEAIGPIIDTYPCTPRSHRRSQPRPSGSITLAITGRKPLYRDSTAWVGGVSRGLRSRGAAEVPEAAAGGLALCRRGSRGQQAAVVGEEALKGVAGAGGLDHAPRVARGVVHVANMGVVEEAPVVPDKRGCCG